MEAIRRNTGLLCAVALGLLSMVVVGCAEDEEKILPPAADASVSFEMTPDAAFPNVTTRDGDVDFYRWETVFQFNETNGGYGYVIGGEVSFIDENGDAAGSQTLELDDIFELFGTDRIVPRGELRAAYRFTRGVSLPFTAEVSFDIVETADAQPRTVTRTFQAQVP